MNFLQPWLLAALPLAALPIIIHLINQRRYQTVPWGAMMFLLAANRMSRGYARIRQWLILLFRTLAIAALVFVISRPLASGWMGATAGGSADVNIVLLDRSPSMSQRGDGTAVSKLETGRRQISDALAALSAQRVVLIDSASPTPRELGANETIAAAADATASDATADLPGMLLETLDYLKNNQIAQADVWICSDLRTSDWQPSDGRWPAIRESYAAFEERVRFHLLAYPDAADGNREIRVTDVKREASDEGAEVVLSLHVSSTSGSQADTSIPIEIEVDGARSVINAELRGGEFEMIAHRIPITKEQVQGWGRVSIPGDDNPADNDFFFVYHDPPPRRTLIVSDDPAAARPLELAASIAPATSQRVEAITKSAGELEGVIWDELMLVLWQAPLPTGPVQERLSKWVENGGRVIFLPPRQLTDTAVWGVAWTDWQNSPSAKSVTTWRGDADLLANTQSGQSLPVGTLRVTRHAGLSGEFTTLASLEDESPLVARAATEKGGVYFLTTTPHIEDSTLASDGVVLYISVQRASLAGAEALSRIGGGVAGKVNGDDAARWQRLAGRDDAISLEQATTSGVYQRQESLLALNRDGVEDSVETLDDSQLAALFQSLPMDRVDDSAGSLGALVREIWRAFLIAMMLALLIEAVLCLPRVHVGGGITA